MGSRASGETTVTEGFAASIPASVRHELDIEPGDRLVWELRQGQLRVRVKKRDQRGFEGFEPFDFGETTNAAEDHDEVI